MTTRSVERILGQNAPINPIYVGLMEAFRPRPRLSLSEWAEANIVLPPERSASPGPYRIGDAVYQKGMLDAITNPLNETIVFMTSSQVGKTSVLTAAQGYYAEQEPSPQLSVFPTQIVADAYIDETFETTLAVSPTLKDTFDGLEYPGGYIAFVGANNPSQLAMRPIRVGTGDEVDRWPPSSGKEGSPITLIRKRMTTYHNRKEVYASTPLHTQTSLILTLFKQTRQHYFLVPCFECDHLQVLKWDNVHYRRGHEVDATYHCERCGCGWTEMQKRIAIRDAEKNGGGWRDLTNEPPFKGFKSDAPPASGRVGYWVCELYSPWSSMAKMALAWSEAEGKATEEQAFVNTSLGLPWDGNVTQFADVDAISARREKYRPKVCPRNAGLVTAAVDVQDDRLEVLTKAWGVEDESWLLEHIVVRQDPSVKGAWEHLAEVLQRRYPHESGRRELGIEIAAVDSGGHFTQKVYEFCAHHTKLGRRWHAIRGVPGEGKLIWRKSEAMMRKGVQVYLVGVDDAKTTIYKRYAIAKPGPGCIHLHEGISEDLIKQMTAEHVKSETDKKGFPKRQWEKKSGARNEMLDLLVYNLAARSSYDIDMPTRLRILNEEASKPVDAAAIGAMFR